MSIVFLNFILPINVCSTSYEENNIKYSNDLLILLIAVKRVSSAVTFVNYAITSSRKRKKNRPVPKVLNFVAFFATNIFFFSLKIPDQITSTIATLREGYKAVQSIGIV